MEKPKPYAHTLVNVLNYTEAADWVDHVLGFGQRDAHDRFPEQGDYLDYWHYALDELFDNDIRNDSFIGNGPFSFEWFAMATEKKFGSGDWRTVIAKVWAQEFPDPKAEEPDARGYTIWMSW